MKRSETSDESNEVELSAVDLVCLAQPSDQVETKHTAAAPRSLRARSYVVIGAVVMALTAGGVYSCLPDASVQKVTLVREWKPLPSEELAPIEEPVVVEQPPVRVRNAFDRSEVFEFPAGTTQQEARDAVAQILMERAMEREPSLAKR